ncbi:MAG TPA: cupredoxin domain-containing protein [Vicinamibacterales bacterium]|nr:cupredoxin domain-containing protein [Vicinamibacterales bacterium]
MCSRRWTVAALVVFVALAGMAGWRVAAAKAAPAPALEQSKGPVNVHARKYSYTPSRIEVEEGDLVAIRFEADDIPHSFTIDDDAYRISKRAAPGHPVVFEFRAEKVGNFPYYCNLAADPECKKMRGELVVRRRR